MPYLLFGCRIFGLFSFRLAFLFGQCSIDLSLELGAIGRNYYKPVVCYFLHLYYGVSSPKCSYCGSFVCQEASVWFAMQIWSPCRSVFNLTRTATVSFHGVGGLTVPRLARELRLLFSHQPPPRVIILEIGTNDLSSRFPEVVIGDLLDLVELLQSVDSSTVVGVCKVLPRRHCSTGLPNEEFNTKAATFKKGLDAVFDDRPPVFVWGHLEIQSLTRRILLPDGVHLKCDGQYCLYWSYRGAILKGVSLLPSRLSVCDACTPRP